MTEPTPTTADALAYTAMAILNLHDNGGNAESGVPLMETELLGSSNMTKHYRSTNLFPRTDEVDLKQFAKGCFKLYLGDRCPSDEPFSAGGHSALDVQAGFAVARANALNGSG